MFTNVRRVALVAAAGISLMACGSTTGRGLLDEGIGLNPYKGVPVGNYFYGDNIPSEARFAAQDQYVAPHCDRYVRETNPSPGKMGGAFAVNHGTAGFGGGAAGFAADTAIVGAVVTGPAILGAGAYNGIASATSGYESGKETGDSQDFNYKKSCMMNNAAGFRSVAPSERDELRRTGHSDSLEKAVEADPAPHYMPTPR